MKTDSIVERIIEKYEMKMRTDPSKLMEMVDEMVDTIVNEKQKEKTDQRMITDAVVEKKVEAIDQETNT